MRRESGFTLVEVMVVSAIIAILAAVAVPAYVNYKNRAIQGEAVEALLRAKMDQEVFWADNNRYAATIGRLASFGNSASKVAATTANGYTIIVTLAGTATFRIRAEKTFYGQADTLAITQALDQPTIGDPAALKFSIFKWIFD